MSAQPVVRLVSAVVVALALLLGVYVATTGATVAAAPARPPTTTAATAEPQPAGWAPVDRAGPAFSVPQDLLDASLTCTPAVDGASVDPVLLLSGTGADPDEAFDWGVEPVLATQDIPTCVSVAPDHNNADIAVRGEYVAHAVRSIAERSGRKVAVVGHSQGGVVIRWALRFWPDLRPLVSDVVALGPPTEGAAPLATACTDTCSAARWQQRAGSEFLAALNSGLRTFPGIDYTVVTSATDAVVTPTPAASALPVGEPGGGTVVNVAVQDLCPGRPVDHVALGTSDAVALALVLDALQNPGPADVARAGTQGCGRINARGITRAELADGTRRLDVAGNRPTTPLPAEPALPCYTRPTGC
jgi:triacylglycerol esterase/lipase EstA (alpha/beta hydrolase family)